MAVRAGGLASVPVFIGQLQTYLMVLQEPETTVSLCQHQQHVRCPKTSFHQHTPLLPVEDVPEYSITVWGVCRGFAWV